MSFEGFVNVSEVLKGGIYLLTYKGEVVYVGKTILFSQRITGHSNRAKEKRKQLFQGINEKKFKAIRFDGVHIMSCDRKNMDDYERRLIAKYIPKYNEDHNLSIKTPLPPEILAAVKERIATMIMPLAEKVKVDSIKRPL